MIGAKIGTVVDTASVLGHGARQHTANIAKAHAECVPSRGCYIPLNEVRSVHLLIQGQLKKVELPVGREDWIKNRLKLPLKWIQTLRKKQMYTTEKLRKQHKLNLRRAIVSAIANLKERAGSTQTSIQKQIGKDIIFQRELTLELRKMFRNTILSMTSSRH